MANTGCRNHFFTLWKSAKNENKDKIGIVHGWQSKFHAFHAFHRYDTWENIKKHLKRMLMTKDEGPTEDKDTRTQQIYKSFGKLFAGILEGITFHTDYQTYPQNNKFEALFGLRQIRTGLIRELIPSPIEVFLKSEAFRRYQFPWRSSLGKAPKTKAMLETHLQKWINYLKKEKFE